MAAVTSAALGVGMSAYQLYQGAKDKSDAQDALNNYNRQDLVNPFENVAVSTVGSDLIREEAGRTSSTIVDSLQKAGSRAILSGIPKVQAGTNAMNKEGQAYLDEQVMNREYAIAKDDTNIRSMQEARENADLAGIGNQLEVGRQDMWSGIRGLASSAMFGANNISMPRARTRGINNAIEPITTPTPMSSYDPIMGSMLG